MRYAFSDCVLDTERCELTRGDQVVALRPKVLKVLTYLIEQRQRVVSKQELFDRLWSGRIVGDATLNSCLKEARKAVGDSGAEQRIVKTLHGQGYHFIAPLHRQPEAAAESAPELAEAAEAVESQDVALADREHKQVSVLACAVANIGVLELDAEAMDELMRRFFATVADTLERYGGTLTERTGDGFSALFGAPHALEDHARRAALAATELERLGPGLTEPGASALVLDLGLHAGAALVSSATDGDQLYTAVGPTMRTAHRLRDLSSGRVLASRDFFALIEPEVDAEPQALSEGVTAYRIRRLFRLRAGVPQRGRAPSPFVGRGEEMSIIRQRLALAGEGAGQAVCISGEPGIGKSRLVREVCATLQGQALLEANCLAYRLASPYFPLQQLLRALCGADDGAVNERIAAELGRRAAAAGIVDEGVVKLLAGLLGAGAIDADKEIPLAGQEAVLRAATRLLLQPSESRPLVIVVEDLHWLDPSSEEWLASFVPRLAGSRVLLLATYRPGYRSRWLTHSSVTQLALPRLNDADSALLIRSLPAPLPASVQTTQRIVSHAQGNPFFLEELSYNLAEGAGADQEAVPTSVQAVLASRIDQLRPTDKSLLQMAAVIGTPVARELLAAMFDREPPAMEPAIQRLEAAELLFERQAGRSCNYHFRHALTEEVAYRSLVGSARRACHRRIARIYETRFADRLASHPEILAHHLNEADIPDKAMEYWTAAGILAAQRSANPEAVLHFEKALAASERLPTSPEIETRQLEIYLRLGSPLMSSRAFTAPSVEQAYLKAKRLCHTVGTREQLFTVLWGLWLHHSHRGHLTEARALSAQIIDLADEIDDPSFRLQAHHTGWTNELWHGDLEDCRRHAMAGVDLYDHDAHGAHRYLFGGHDPGVCANGSAGLATWFLGFPDTSRRLTQDGAELATRLDHPFSYLITRNDFMELESFWRDPEAALRYANEGIELCTELNVPNYLAVGRIHAGWAMAAMGDRDQGRELLIRGLAEYAATGAERKQAQYLLLLAEASASPEHCAEGLAALERARELIERTGEVRWVPEILRLEGELLLVRSSAEATRVRELFERAQGRAADQGCKAYELRAALSLALLLQRQGYPDQARAALQPAFEWFTEGFSSGDLKRAAAALAELAAC